MGNHHKHKHVRPVGLLPTGFLQTMALRLSLAAAALILAAQATVAVAHDYQIGEIIVYDNPYDDVPARKGRVTKISGDQIWVDFREFNPGLNIADSSKILFKGTNQVDDWTRPDAPEAGAPAGANAGAPAPQAMTRQTAPAQTAMHRQPATAPAPVAAPATGSLASLFGRWSTLQIGHTVITAPGDGYIYQQQEVGAKAGEIIIRADGTYSWNSKSQGLINGSWREATASELRGGYAGPGIRLIHGETGWDYNVQMRAQTGVQNTASISIWTSGYQVNAYKVG
jgi:hypothetical protein